MNAQLNPGDVVFNLAVQIANEFGRGCAHGVGQGDRPHPDILEPLQCIGDNLRSPGFVIRVSKGHRNINYQAPICRSGLLLQFLNELTRFLARHIGVGAAKIRRDGVRIADGCHSRGGQGALQSFFVHNNSDDF